MPFWSCFVYDLCLQQSDASKFSTPAASTYRVTDARHCFAHPYLLSGRPSSERISHRIDIRGVEKIRPERSGHLSHITGSDAAQPTMAEQQDSSGRSVSPASAAGNGSTSPTVSRMTPSSSNGSKAPKQRTLSTTSDANGASKITKRRAARACVSCRARKVRCDVVEGAPCGNCRWDNVECIVQESRRRK